MRAKQIEKIDNRVFNDGFSAFIEEIRNGNVLLMVGHAFEANTSVFNGSFYNYVLDQLNSIAGTTDLDFSDLSCDNRFLLDKDNPNHIRSLHEEIINIIEQNEYSAQEDASEGLLSLIRTGLFRFVFTTSFDPLVEITMKEVFGEVRVMNIYDKANRDVTTKADFDNPTIYYLFGKASLPNETEVMKKFVATDNDALEVLKKWQLDMNNSALLRYTADKYLLTLGCPQNDWLFRFIWYTMKGDGNNLSKGMIAGHEKSESLSHYLKMNHILIDNNADELSKKIIAAISNDNDEFKWNKPPTRCDVFISYSRADSVIASQLCDALTVKGLRVWYDKNNLGGRHGGRFLDVLREAIDTSTLFVAILTQSISEQANDIHVYRKEWEWAKELKLGLTADCRCYATFADNYDLYERKYQDSLGWLAETDNFEFSAEHPDFSQWADALQAKINNLRVWKQKK